MGSNVKLQRVKRVRLPCVRFHGYAAVYDDVCLRLMPLLICLIFLSLSMFYVHFPLRYFDDIAFSRVARCYVSAS